MAVFKINDHVFPTKKAATAAIRAEVDPYRNTPAIFRSSLMSDLLRERHYGCVKYDLTPTAFQWMPDDRFSADRTAFSAFFDDRRYPHLKQKVLSYNKALDNWKPTVEDIVKDFFRFAIRPAMRHFRNTHPFCRCGALAIHVDHVDPEFDGMANEALTLYTPEMRAAMLLEYDWTNSDRWTPPACVYEHFFDMHATCRLEAVCRRCHTENARGRKLAARCAQFDRVD